MIKHPDAIFVQLTTGCNATCVSCPHPFTYGAQGSHAKGNMSKQVWGVLVDQIRKADYRGQVGLYLHHEPLLVKSLYTKIKEINETTNAYVVLSTNGELLDDEAQEKMLDALPRQIHININSADRQQYEQMMRLDYDATFDNARRFIERAKGKIAVEINCPVLPEVDTLKLVEAFPGVPVNTDYWANSRGGLLESVTAAGHASRFQIKEHCRQPTQNFNVLWDGAVIACCMDWAHETRRDFPNILETDLFETYTGPGMQSLQAEFEEGRYGRYKMCQNCSIEMGFFRVGDDEIAPVQAPSQPVAE